METIIDIGSYIVLAIIALHGVTEVFGIGVTHRSGPSVDYNRFPDSDGGGY